VIWTVQAQRQHNLTGPGINRSTQAAFYCWIWQFIVPTLSQRLRSFPTKSRATLFFLCRQDYPLPPPMNRGGFHGLNMKESGLKIAKNQLTPLFFSSQCFSLPAAFSVLENPTETFLLHQQTMAQPPYGPKSSPAVEQPLRTPFSLLYKPFSSSSYSQLRPPFPQSMPPEPPVEPTPHPNHHHARWPSFSSSFFLPLLVAIACRRYSVCNGKIINFEGGLDLLRSTL